MHGFTSQATKEHHRETPFSILSSKQRPDVSDPLMKGILGPTNGPREIYSLCDSDPMPSAYPPNWSCRHTHPSIEHFAVGVLLLAWIRVGYVVARHAWRLYRSRFLKRR